MSDTTPRRIDGPDAALGEGPLWDARLGRLWWVDIVASVLHCFDPATGDTDSVTCVEPSLSMVVPSIDGGLVVAVESGLATIDPSTGATTRLGDLAPGEGIRMNDGNVDPQGRLWVGSMAYAFTSGASSLYRVERGRHSTAVTGITCSNGIGWSLDGDLMYHVDTPTQQIAVFDFDGVEGSIGDRRVLAEIDPADGAPDGIAIDAEGGIWLALWDGGEIRRYGSDGTLEHRVATGVERPTCPEFGGDDLDVLYFTAAATDDGSPGGLFEIGDVGVRGRTPDAYDPGIAFRSAAD